MAVVAYEKENADIWVHDLKAGTHRKITTFAGEDRSPVFADGDKAFYYLSEESGTFNVHKLPLTGGKSQQLTSFKGLPVRFLSIANNGTLASTGRPISSWSTALFSALP